MEHEPTKLGLQGLAISLKRTASLLLAALESGASPKTIEWVMANVSRENMSLDQYLHDLMKALKTYAPENG